MTTPLWCLAIVALLPYPLAFAGGYFKMRQFGAIDNKHPRQQAQQLEGVGARALAAQANAWEALGVFTAVVAVLCFANPEAARGATAANLSLGFVATRVLHPIFYLANVDVARSLVFVAGMGTGGTISGAGKYLKEKNPKVQIVGADPEGSILCEYFYTKQMGHARTYKTEGIGEDIIPGSTWFEYIDRVITHNDHEAYNWARRVSREEGILIGSS